MTLPDISVGKDTSLLSYLSCLRPQCVYDSLRCGEAVPLVPVPILGREREHSSGKLGENLSSGRVSCGAVRLEKADWTGQAALESLRFPSLPLPSRVPRLRAARPTRKKDPGERYSLGPPFL